MDFLATNKQKMKTEKLDSRFAVVKKLQERLSLLDPQSYEFELIDKAYSLALNPKRKVDDFFYKNLIRDAGRILRRQPKKQLISINSNPQFKVEDLVHDRAITKNEAEAYFDNITIQNTVTFICELMHKRAHDVLVCMIDGYNINETADRSKLSASLVKKLRSQIKNEVKLQFQN